MARVFGGRTSKRAVFYRISNKRTRTNNRNIMYRRQMLTKVFYCFKLAIGLELFGTSCVNTIRASFYTSKLLCFFFFYYYYFKEKHAVLLLLLLLFLICDTRYKV